MLLIAVIASVPDPINESSDIRALTNYASHALLGESTEPYKNSQLKTPFKSAFGTYITRTFYKDRLCSNFSKEYEYSIGIYVETCVQELVSNVKNKFRHVVFKGK
jgi:hypothetical protein